MTFAESIKRVRIESGFTQAELSDIFGCNISTLSRWENGRVFPKNKVADRINKMVSRMDLTESCKQDVRESLQVIRRLGVPLANVRFPKADMELLEQIIGEADNPVYVVDMKTFEILYANRATEKIAMGKYEYSNDQKCYEYVQKKHLPCTNCIIDKLKEKDIAYQKVDVEGFTEDYWCKAKKMKWNNRDIAVVYACKNQNMNEEFAD